MSATPGSPPRPPLARWGGTATVAERELASLVGAEHVRSDGLEAFTIDGMSPGLWVAPANPQEVAAVLRFASREQLVVVPAGGFTQQAMGLVPERIDLVLDLRRLNAIEYYDPSDLTIGVQAGATVVAVQQLVAEHRQLLPLDVALRETATIGGTLATAAHGPLKFSFGGPREFCVGVQFATADGKVAKAGGRVVKNVAGYDLMKLMIGSFGTLGVITSANFKLFPAPRQYGTFGAEFARLEDAIAFRDDLLHSRLTPLALEIMTPGTEQFVGVGGPPLSLPSLERQDGERSWRVLLRVGGSDAVLTRYRCDLSSMNSARVPLREFADGEEAQLWRAVSDFPATVRSSQSDAMVLNVATPIAGVQAVLQSVETIAARHGFIAAGLGRVTGSLILALVPADSTPQESYAALVAALRAALPRDSSVLVAACPTQTKRHIDVWGPSPNDLVSMKLIKRTMDANDILNRGRFLF